MAFVRTDKDRSWVCVEGLRTCPQVVQMAIADGMYVNMDFSMVLDQDTTISSVAWTEVDASSITIADQSVSGDGKTVSCKLSSLTAGDYTLRATATLSTGTTQTISKDGILKAV